MAGDARGRRGGARCRADADGVDPDAGRHRRALGGRAPRTLARGPAPAARRCPGRRAARAVPSLPCRRPASPTSSRVPRTDLGTGRVQALLGGEPGRRARALRLASPWPRSFPSASRNSSCTAARDEIVPLARAGPMLDAARRRGRPGRARRAPHRRPLRRRRGDRPGVGGRRRLARARLPRTILVTVRHKDARVRLRSILVTVRHKDALRPRDGTS